MQFRGGSSKGLYFLASDLPSEVNKRDQVILATMGADNRQIDGLGGADPLTSKVGIISLSSRADADIDYLFVQVVVGENRVDTTPNCGNILAAIGPFAIESGLIEADSPTTSIRVHMLNSGNLCEVVIQTPDGIVNYAGDAKIDGVPGTSATVICNYLDVAGSACGELLPTGNIIDDVCGIHVTCIDNGMPVVVIRAEDIGISGYESSDELNADTELKQRLEDIRLAIGPRMNLGDVSKKVVPKMSIISAPLHGGDVTTRTFIPHVCHVAIGVLGAVSVATACVIPGSIADGIAKVSAGSRKKISIEHPRGEFTVELELDTTSRAPTLLKAGVLRTARLLAKGVVCIPPGILQGL